jgi:hypothetical protein
MKRKRFTQEQIIGILKEPEVGCSTVNLFVLYGSASVIVAHLRADFVVQLSDEPFAAA